MLFSYVQYKSKMSFKNSGVILTVLGFKLSGINNIPSSFKGLRDKANLSNFRFFFFKHSL